MSYRVSIGATTILLLLLYLAFYLLGYLLPSGSPQFSPPSTLLDMTYNYAVEPLVERIGLIGIIILAMLSGFGSISTPYTTMHRFIHDVSDHKIRQLEELLLRTNEIIFRNLKLKLEYEV